jgi:hypothetical protein
VCQPLKPPGETVLVTTYTSDVPLVLIWTWCRSDLAFVMTWMSSNTDLTVSVATNPELGVARAVSKELMRMPETQQTNRMDSTAAVEYPFNRMVLMFFTLPFRVS